MQNQNTEHGKELEEYKEKLDFHCPKCGDDRIGFGRKLCQKASITREGLECLYGIEIEDEDSFEWFCWDCGYVITDEDGLIRDEQKLVEWLTENCKQQSVCL
jgi:predicted RNA-binding Zn-ribbon protein involved in translation (DUF1610 family)